MLHAPVIIKHTPVALVSAERTADVQHVQQRSTAKLIATRMAAAGGRRQEAGGWALELTCAAVNRLLCYGIDSHGSF